MRVPAWCDRVLVRSLPSVYKNLTHMAYGCCDDVMFLCELLDSVLTRVAAHVIGSSSSLCCVSVPHFDASSSTAEERRHYMALFVQNSTPLPISLQCRATIRIGDLRIEGLRFANNEVRCTLLLRWA